MMEKIIATYFDLAYKKLMLEREHKSTFFIETELENCRLYLHSLVKGENHGKQYRNSKHTSDKG